MLTTLFCNTPLQENHLLRIVFIVDIPGHNGEEVEKKRELRVVENTCKTKPGNQQSDTPKT